ncbi:UDP-glucosyltransferase 2-like [Daphnia carinata]|uniref:UDP-glucosyltransferase 2-like n=1 Tax=Daphnia carinata TaxID=120202 RepID=UPI0028691489|nr:UDP-glucosyltransferase 2-like [Daphnia carinata]
MKGHIFLLLLAYQLAPSSAARILVLSPLGPRSHLNSMMPMVETLAQKGHHLTVVTPHSVKTQGPNIRKILAKELLEFVDVEWYDFKRFNMLDNTMGIFHFFRTTMTPAYGSFMANKEIQEIKRNKDYDIVIMDAIVNDFAFPLIDHLGKPFIFFDPGPGTSWNWAAKGASHEYASIPPLFGTFSSPMTFAQRMTNAVLTEALLIVRKFYLLSTLDNLAKKDFPLARPIAEIEKRSELCFINLHPASSWPRSLPPTYVPVPAMHVRPIEPLPEDWQRFADGAENGLIVFTLGSNSRVSSMPSHIFQTFVQVFSRLPQRIVWKWEKDNLSELPGNIKIVDWLPQQDLLGHKNTRLFIAHGGIMGIQEAIYHQVPILGLPLGRDQNALLSKASQEGYAVKLEWEDLTEDLLYKSIQRMVNEPSYKGNATRLSRLMRDQLVPSREVAAYWVEHVLHQGGTKHLQSIDMPFYQLYLIDVWLFLFASLSLLAFVNYKIAAVIVRRLSTAKLKTQ